MCSQSFGDTFVESTGHTIFPGLNGYGAITVYRTNIFLGGLADGTNTATEKEKTL